jgi:hypothetical protein
VARRSLAYSAWLDADEEDRGSDRAFARHVRLGSLYALLILVGMAGSFAIFVWGLYRVLF